MGFLFLNEAYEEAQINISANRVFTDDEIKIEECMKTGTYEGLLEYQILCEKELLKLQIEEVTLLNEEEWILNEADAPAVGATPSPAPDANKGAADPSNNNPKDSNVTQDTSSTQSGDNGDTKKKFSQKIRDYIMKVINFVKSSSKNFQVWINQFTAFARKAYTKWKNDVDSKKPIKASNAVVDGKFANDISTAYNDINANIIKLVSLSNKEDSTDADISTPIKEIEAYKDDGSKSFSKITEQLSSNNQLVETTSDVVWNNFMIVDKAFHTLEKNLISFNTVSASEADKMAQDQNNLDKVKAGKLIKLSRCKQTISAIISKSYNLYWNAVVNGLKNPIQQVETGATQQPVQNAQPEATNPTPAPAPAEQQTAPVA